MGTRGGGPWPDYARRTADAAFSPKGTQDIARAGKYVDQWQAIKEKALMRPGGDGTPPMPPRKEQQQEQHRGFGLELTVETG